MSAAYGWASSASERYGDGWLGHLPWGYWLTSIGEVAGEPPLVDGDGRTWGSVRQAFWVGRLGLPKVLDLHMAPSLEFMMCYLAMFDERLVPKQERTKDLFLGDKHFDHFYSQWMESIGLMDSVSHRPTVEGRAALLMLMATRTREDAEAAVGREWVVANRSVAPAADRASAAEMVRRNEEVAARMAHRFAIDELGGMPAVKLIGLRITPEIPVRSTVWSMTWPDRDRHARDLFYLWLIQRIDRWDEWNAIVASAGPRALTEHLMRLAFCDRFAEGMGPGSRVET